MRRSWQTALLVTALLPVACTGDDTTGAGTDEPPSDQERWPARPRRCCRPSSRTDAAPDDDAPVSFWGLYAMAEVGRTVHLLVGVPEDAPLDGQSVADTVLDSLVLEPAA